MTCGTTLIEILQGVLERTYGMRPDLVDGASFLIGDKGFRVLYGDTTLHQVPTSTSGAGARTLVRETPAGIRVSVYYPDELIRRLERFPPQRGVFEGNVDAFATLVEELDHLLCIAERVEQGRPVSMFELELHANISKHIVLARFLAGPVRRLAPVESAWLRYHLFHKHTFTDPDPVIRARYEDASRFAFRFLAGLRRLRSRERLAALRRFHELCGAGKVTLIESLAG